MKYLLRAEILVFCQIQENLFLSYWENKTESKKTFGCDQNILTYQIKQTKQSISLGCNPQTQTSIKTMTFELGGSANGNVHEKL